MRIVVISDSHGNKWNFYDVIDNEPTAEVFYFLGDGYREYEEIKDVYGGEKAFIGVLGNCDLGSDLPCRDIRTVGGKKIYATHGFQEKVKFGLYELEHEARQNDCDIVLFGHTHQPLSTYSDGLYVFNPGSLRDGFYGVIDITENGVLCFNKNVV